MNEEMEQAIEKFTQSARIVAEALNRWMKLVEKETQTAFERILANKNLTKPISPALIVYIPPYKWVHLSKYAKKSRTRKKYRNRLRRFYGSDDW